MATYRGAVPTEPPEKTVTSAQGGADPGPSDTSPAVPADVIWKLLGFSFAMIVLPIGGFYFTRRMIFKGESWSNSSGVRMETIVNGMP
jgi:hypothetical protein